MKNAKKPSYFLSIFKNGFILPALFISALTLTVLCFGYKQNAYENIKSNQNLFLFLSIAFGYFMLISVLYMFFSTKKKHVSLADSLAFSYLFTGLFYALFLLLVAKDFDLFRLIFCGVLFLIGLAFLIVNGISFNPNAKIKNIYYTSHSISGYYSTIFKDFSFFGILLSSFAFCCFAFIFNEANFLEALQNKRYFFVVFACIFPFILYYSTSLSSKKIIAFDAYLLSQIIAMPVVVAHTIIINDAKLEKLIICIVGIVIILVSTILRYYLFDTSVTDFKNVNTNSDWEIVNYIKRLFSQFNPLLMLAIGGLLSFVSLLSLFRLSNYYKVASLINGSLIFDLKALPFFFVNLVCYGTLIASGIISIVNIKSNDVTSGDFTLGILLSFIFFASLSLFVVPSIWVTLEIVIATSIAFSILGSRVRNLKK